MPQRISELLEQLKTAERALAKLSTAALAERVPSLVASATRHGSLTSVIASVGSLDSVDGVRQLVTDVRDRLSGSPAVVALGAVIDGKAAVVVATNDAARGAGVTAGPLAKAAAALLGGGGGGRDDMAQAGGPHVEQLDAALSAITTTISS